VLKPVLPFLETMITYACNLSCHGCTNYSDYNMKGNIKWADGRTQLEGWLEKLDISDFGLIGGEPLLNPELDQWMFGCRKLMPHSQIRITTNASLFLQKPQLLDWCIDIGNCVLKFSIHEDQTYTTESIEYVFSKHNWSPISEHGINRWTGPNNTKFQINYPKKFIKTYQGTYGNIKPYNSNPTNAFDICVQKNCPLLYQGKIYKCSSVALLKKVLLDWDQSLDDQWYPYINEYRPLTLNSNDKEILQFLDNFNQPHKICRMCPSTTDINSIVDHKINVIRKKDWIRLHRV